MALPKRVKTAYKYLFLVIKALGKILGYFLENLGYFFTKPSGQISHKGSSLTNSVPGVGVP